jgi:hypothetical protein
MRRVADATSGCVSPLAIAVAIMAPAEAPSKRDFRASKRLEGTSLAARRSQTPM